MIIVPPFAPPVSALCADVDELDEPPPPLELFDELPHAAMTSAAAITALAVSEIERFTCPLLLSCGPSERRGPIAPVAGEPERDAIPRSHRMSSGTVRGTSGRNPCGRGGRPGSTPRVGRHVAQVGLDVDPAAGRRLDERLGVQAPAVAVHVLGEPLADRGDVAGAQRRVL